MSETRKSRTLKYSERYVKVFPTEKWSPDPLTRYELDFRSHYVSIVTIKSQKSEVDKLILDTLSKTTPSAGRGGQPFQLISLLLGNTYQLKGLAATSC